MPSYEEFMGSGGITMFPWAFNGYALANGATLPIEQNTALYSLMGVQFGGDGRVNFALPNFNGRLPMGQGTGAGLTPRIVGQAAGAESVVLGVDNLPPHTHSVALGGVNAAASANGPHVQGAQQGGGSHMVGTESTGHAVPVGIMPPTMTVSFLVALTGLYPVRG